MPQHRATSVLLAFGANLAFGTQPPETTISRTIRALKDQGLPVVTASRLYRTPCFPHGAGPDYINAAASVTPVGEFSPQDVLAILHRIEGDCGRARDGRWAGRTLDIDLLAMGESVLPDRETHAHWRDLPLRDQVSLAPGELILPHPRLQDRAFVLVPLADVAPDWVHPVLGLSVVQMLARRPAEEIASVVALDGSPHLGVAE